ncbi:hypothetical protein Mapa_006752 [Marchantia paleacea]|nr:hypothetical protein Mapa_006752 [Marchantia paleacea]
MDQSRQKLVLMKGHPGCAKSTVARALASALRCPVVDKDDIRDATLCLEASDRPAPPAPTTLNALSYEVMWRVVETQLQIGLSVVVDCPLARTSLFQVASALALKYGSASVIVECVARDLHEWKRRLEARARIALSEGDDHHHTVLLPTHSRNSRGSEAQIGGPSLHASLHGDGRVQDSVDSPSQRSQGHVAVPKYDASSVDLVTNTASSVDGNRPTTGDDGKRGLKNWHKPSRWEDIQKLLEGYAKCYEYDTGLTKKLIVDTTSLSTEAAVSGIQNWLRSVEDTSTAIVTSLP